MGIYKHIKRNMGHPFFYVAYMVSKLPAKPYIVKKDLEVEPGRNDAKFLTIRVEQDTRTRVKAIGKILQKTLSLHRIDVIKIEKDS